MSDESAGYTPSSWVNPAGAARHHYGLAVRNHGLGTAFGLLMRTGVVPETVCEECADISGRLRAGQTA